VAKVTNSRGQKYFMICPKVTLNRADRLRLKPTRLKQVEAGVEPAQLAYFSLL